MKAIIHSPGQVLYSPSQYAIPVFQRHYRCELPQWQRLWDSLEEIQQARKTGRQELPDDQLRMPLLPRNHDKTVFVDVGQVHVAGSHGAGSRVLRAHAERQSPYASGGTLRCAAPGVIGQGGVLAMKLI